MKLFRAIAMIVAAFFVSTAAFGQGLPSQKVLTFELAEELAHAAMAACRADGHHVSVVVVDPLNEYLVVLRDNGSVPANLEFAKLKATTAILFRTPSATAYPLVEQKPPVRALLQGTWNHGGGVPIQVDGYTIGAIATAGAGTGENDAACSNAAVEKLKDKLK
jgi:uncharacterized protein GlcG (DUF336 family)